MSKTPKQKIRFLPSEKQLHDLALKLSGTEEVLLWILALSGRRQVDLRRLKSSNGDFE